MKLKINNEEYELKYKEELQCAEETINSDLKDQPSFFAWYVVLAELADADLNQAKLDLEIMEAHLSETIRNESEEKLSDKKVSLLVGLQEDYIAARQRVNECKKNVGVLKGIKEAFSHRKDMLIALASNMRAQSDPSIFVKTEEHRRKK